MYWLMMLGPILWSSFTKGDWICPTFVNVSCSCDFPHILRCTGRKNTLPFLADSLRHLSGTSTISLFDCTMEELETLPGEIFKDVSLQGLVISSGVLKNISETAFDGIKDPLEALGLPSNQLQKVPTEAFARLETLKRLDLSQNDLQELSNLSFKDLIALKFLDLSGNQIMNISSSTFISVPQLKILRLQSNHLKTEIVSKLRGLMKLEELDLSSNTIMGPLNSTFLSFFPKLLILNLARNQISSIAKDSLSKLPSLQTLILNLNMIDVLEDHAFRFLPTLEVLDLAHNRIVAVSDASLAHLTNLQVLDLSHNFLRALTTDLISPLSNLKVLKLDDNDISMIVPNVMKADNKLETLSLSENPLNCDCSLISFISWLTNTSTYQKVKTTAVCATPPFLENALVEELTPSQLVCDEDDINLNFRKHRMPISGSRVTLQGFNYDGLFAYFLWNIEPIGLYYCDSLFIYEELGAHEVLLERIRISCNYTNFVNSHNLPITIEATQIRKGHRYRYCIVMVDKGSTEPSLVLGCSGILNVHGQVIPQVFLLEANITSKDEMVIEAYVWPQNSSCYITFHVFYLSHVIKQSKLRCSAPKLIINDLEEEGPFQVCAYIFESVHHCKWIEKNESLNDEKNNLSFVLLLIFFLTFSMIYMLLRCYKTFFIRPKLNEQFFLPSTQNETTQHSKYVKLHATTKV